MPELETPYPGGDPPPQRATSQTHSPIRNVETALSTGEAPVAVHMGSDEHALHSTLKGWFYRELE